MAYSTHILKKNWPRAYALTRTIKTWQSLLVECHPTDKLPPANNTLTYGILERLETPGVPGVPRVTGILRVPGLNERVGIIGYSG
jgi:hypothetical protein